MHRIDAFLQLAREQGCSDIHFAVGQPPLVRMDGQLTPLKYRTLTADETHAILEEILPDARREEVNRRGSVDLSYWGDEIGRFRINVFRKQTGWGAACRVLPVTVPELASLGLPSVVGEFATLTSGLVLVTGGTGCGKSTTLSALLNEMNKRRHSTIVTLEDPVEFVHESRNCQIVQREIGSDIMTFADGLRSALRQDPDVIMVGELRDPESIALAIEASETGHLVLGTLHTRGAYQTLHRLIDVFPADAQHQVRHTLSENLRAVVSQELVRMADGRGRRAVVEIMIVTPAVAQLIREQKIYQVPGQMATGRRLGMQLMDQALLTLVKSGDIDPDEAFLRASDKAELARYVTRADLLSLIEDAAAGSVARGPLTERS
jgi:twitching motility protein PilT